MPWQEMRALRNVLVHEYFSLLSTLLWNTIHDDLFPLLPKLIKIRQQLDALNDQDAQLNFDKK